MTYFLFARILLNRACSILTKAQPYCIMIWRFSRRNSVWQSAWFGTKMPQVRILSPRPFVFAHFVFMRCALFFVPRVLHIFYSHAAHFKRPSRFVEAFLSCPAKKSLASPAILIVNTDFQQNTHAAKKFFFSQNHHFFRFNIDKPSMI